MFRSPLCLPKTDSGHCSTTQNLAIQKLTTQTNLALTTLAIITVLNGCAGSGGTKPTTQIQPEVIPNEPIAINDSGIAGSLKQQTLPHVNEVWALGHRGEGITIGIVDSGVNPFHYEFYDDNGQTRIDYTQARGVYTEDGINVELNGNYVDIDRPDYHGTHIASIALGREYGVAPDATLLPVNVFSDNDSAYNNAVWKGVDYAAGKSPIVNTSISDMVNLSLDGAQNSELSLYVDTLTNKDVVMVTVAGNGGEDQLGDPVGAEHFENNETYQNLAIQNGLDNQVLSVIALNDSLERASFSNFPGACSHVSGVADTPCDPVVMSRIQDTFISALGFDIEAADGGSNTLTQSYSGTSMAAPSVSGSLALLLSAWEQLTPQQAVQLLKDNADRDFSGYSAAEYGVGILNVEAAFEPSGELKSAASASTEKAYSLVDSTLKLSSSLKALTHIPALTEIAYFDDYDRDYLVDLTTRIDYAEPAIQWVKHWHRLSNSPTTAYLVNDPANDLTISLALDPNSVSKINQFQLNTTDTQVNFSESFSTISPLLDMTNQNGFIANINPQSQQKLALTHTLHDGYQMILAYHRDTPQDIDNLPHSPTTNSTFSGQNKTLGLIYQASPYLNIGYALRQDLEQNSFMTNYGAGAFGLGKRNQSQYQQITAAYRLNPLKLFGEFSQGELSRHQSSTGSYFEIDHAKYLELKLGLLAHTERSLFGMQLYNQSSLQSADFVITTPSGMNANGEMTYQTSEYKHRSDIKLDSIELFYQHQLTRQTELAWNLIRTPANHGLGFSVNQTF